MSYAASIYRRSASRITAPDTAAAEPSRCPRCGIYADAHARCPVTVWCPHCAAEPGDRCVKPDGSAMLIGSHGRRQHEAKRPDVHESTGTGWPT